MLITLKAGKSRDAVLPGTEAGDGLETVDVSGGVVAGDGGKAWLDAEAGVELPLASVVVWPTELIVVFVSAPAGEWLPATLAAMPAAALDGSADPLSDPAPHADSISTNPIASVVDQTRFELVVHVGFARAHLRAYCEKNCSMTSPRSRENA